MRKIAAIFCSGMLTACAAADLPAVNPCETFGKASLGEPNYQSSELPTIFGYTGKSFYGGGILVPALTPVTDDALNAALGVTEPHEVFFGASNLNYMPVPKADGVHFAMGWSGSLGCGYFVTFRLRGGTLEELPAPAYSPEDYCPGPDFRVVLIDGRPYLGVYLRMSTDPDAPRRRVGRYEFRAIGKAGVSADLACEVTLNWVAYRGSFSGTGKTEAITESFAPVLKALEKVREEIATELEKSAPKLVPLLSESARAISDDGKTVEFRFEGVDYVLETQQPDDRAPLFTLRRNDTGALIDVEEYRSFRVDGFVVR